MCTWCCREIVRACLLSMFILSVFSALLVFCPVVRVSFVPPSFSSLVPTFLIPIFPHLSLLCLIVPSPLFLYSNLPSLPFCTTLSFVSNVSFHALFFMFDDYHLDYWPDCLRLLDWICFLDWTVYQYILWGKNDNTFRCCSLHWSRALLAVTVVSASAMMGVSSTLGPLKLLQGCLNSSLTTVLVVRGV